MREDTLQPRTAKDVIRKFIPQFILQQRGIIRRLGPRAGRIYTGLRMRDVIGMRADNQRTAPASARSFVFVCFGNIMRSAMAEFMTYQALGQASREQTGKTRIVSAGLHASPGREAHPWAQQAAADLGISLTTHRAKILTPAMVDEADAIFAMDFQNKAELLTLYPDSADKIYMLSAYAEGAWKNREIPDPYLGDLEITRFCARQLQTCVRNLLAQTIFCSPAKREGSHAYDEPLTRS